jgi:hypothetical protein
VTVTAYRFWRTHFIEGETRLRAVYDSHIRLDNSDWADGSAEAVCHFQDAEWCAAHGWQAPIQEHDCPARAYQGQMHPGFGPCGLHAYYSREEAVDPGREGRMRSGTPGQPERPLLVLGQVELDGTVLGWPSDNTPAPWRHLIAAAATLVTLEVPMTKPNGQPFADWETLASELESSHGITPTGY